MNVVVVESPAKAKTINKYLGQDFTVLASYGHVRDLPPKDGSVRPDDDFDMDWEVSGDSNKHIGAITKAVKGADVLYLATDPDREGEAISWHVEQVLRSKKALNGVDVRRVVFHEITKNAVTAAMAQPRDIDAALVEAYLARRALDYLVGFSLSPVLWRKLPKARSAGRVQSVALRLICEREAEIEVFKPREYWSVHALFHTPKGEPVTAALTHLNGAKLDKFDLADEAAAKRAVDAIESRDFSVQKVEKKKVRRNPAPPFTTSTLQQEASRKLRFSARKTMQVAQKLYEGVDIGGETVGLITYMRTDAVNLAGEAIAATRGVIEQEFGAEYVPSSPRAYKTKAKNAQEAHEAIRPTDPARLPKRMAAYLSDDQRALYELIWKRTLACQMEQAVLDQVTADVASGHGAVVLRATGTTIDFPGFLKLYREDIDDSDNGNGEDRRLPPLVEGDAMARQTVTPEQHFTQPPPRYTEASLVKKMEELGIGRPSTYASIISVLQDREYVRLESRRFIPEDRGRLVTAFLTRFFERYVQYNFTADLENQLDEISGGRADWKSVLMEFWGSFKQLVEETAELTMKDVTDALDNELGPHFFVQNEDGSDPRVCPTCKEGRLSLKLGRFGAFIGCANYPDCRYTRPLAVGNGENGDDGGALAEGPKLLGTDPETGLPVTLRKGPYGVYVQLGEAPVPEETPKGKKKKVAKPKRASLPKGMDPMDVTLEKALSLLSLPRDVGVHPESGEMITAGLGRFGPFIKHNGVYVSLKGDDDVLSIGINRAVTLIAESGKTPPENLGDHPKGGAITVHKGRFGPYVQHGKVRATLPKTLDKADLTIEKAVELLEAKAGRAKNGKGGAKAKPAAKKSTAKKTTTKKATTKKATTKKAPAKKKTTAQKKAAPTDEANSDV